MTFFNSEEAIIILKRYRLTTNLTKNCDKTTLKE